jgi:hypothetical protein
MLQPAESFGNHEDCRHYDPIRLLAKAATDKSGAQCMTFIKRLTWREIVPQAKLLHRLEAKQDTKLSKRHDDPVWMEKVGVRSG